MTLSLALRQLCVCVRDLWAGFCTWRGAGSSLQKAAKRQLNAGDRRQQQGSSWQAAKGSSWQLQGGQQKESCGQLEVGVS